MTPAHEFSVAELRDAAREMAETGRPTLARLLNEEADKRAAQQANPTEEEN